MRGGQPSALQPGSGREGSGAGSKAADSVCWRLRGTRGCQCWQLGRWDNGSSQVCPPHRSPRAHRRAGLYRNQTPSGGSWRAGAAPQEDTGDMGVPPVPEAWLMSLWGEAETGW